MGSNRGFSERSGGDRGFGADRSGDSRDFGAGGRGGGGFSSSDREDRRFDRNSSRDRSAEGGDEAWARGNPRTFTESARPSYDSGFSGDRGGDDAWRKSGPTSRSGSQSFSSDPTSSSARPRLNLAPRTVPIPDGSRTTNAAPERRSYVPSDEPNDKWSNVFKKPSTSSSSQRAAATESSADKSGAQDNYQTPKINALSISEQTAVNNSNSSIQAKPKDASTSPPIEAVPTTTKKETAPKEDPKAAAKAAKAAERAAREESERLARAEKDAAFELEKAQLLAINEAAVAAVATDLKSAELTTFIIAQDVKTSAPALLTAVLNRNADMAPSLSWCTSAEYAPALKHLMGKKISEQVKLLYAFQAYCHRLKFPKIEVKGAPRNLFEVVFQLLYKNEIIDEAAFLAWAEDEDDTIGGKVTAVVQTTTFIALLRDCEDDDEEYEDDEVDAPSTVIP